ncbi:MAG: nucleotidyltransferase domain-containing protein [Ichthyobacteriaceae bacterium]|nr:nucleotidyltransferase domain-containing protein [Ichthyobacteriaceae bacterium]
MKSILTKNMNEINILCNSHNVKKLFAFGSVMTNKFNRKSDIDLLISFNPTKDHGDYADNYFDLVEKFEKLFQRNVDLVTDKSLSNPYFIESINKTKTLLYGN